jgi:hypothetical protein
MKRAGVILAWAVLQPLAWPALGDESTRPIEVPGEVSHQILDLKASVPGTVSSAEKVLMEYAGPLSVAAHEGDTLRSIVERECPGASEQYMQRALQDVPRLNGSATIPDPDSKLAVGDSTIFIPFCIGSQFESYTIQPGDRLWDIYKKEKDYSEGFKDWHEFLTQYEYLNPSSDVGVVGSEIHLPKAELKIPIPSGSVAKATDELRKQISNGTFEIKKPNWGTLQADVGGDECEEDAAPLKIAETKFRVISDALTLNGYVDENHPWHRSSTKPVIGLFDGGIDGIDLPVMRNVRKKISPSIKSADLLVLPGYDQKFHGSGVMSLAIGGHLLAQISSIFDLIDVAPYRIVDKICEPDVGSANLTRATSCVNSPVFL